MKSLLFVPADSERKLAKAESLGVLILNEPAFFQMCERQG